MDTHFSCFTNDIVIMAIMLRTFGTFGLIHAHEFCNKLCKRLKQTITISLRRKKLESKFSFLVLMVTYIVACQNYKYNTVNY